MDFKKILDNFIWKEENNYIFSIPDKSIDTNYISDTKLNINKNVFINIDQNLDYIKTRFNSIINSDVIIREFMLEANNKEYKSFLLFIDGMVDSNLINDFILKPLMSKNESNFNNKKIISEEQKNNVTIRKIKKFDLKEYIYNSLIPQNNLSQEKDFDTIASDVNGRKLYFVC